MTESAPDAATLFDAAAGLQRQGRLAEAEVAWRRLLDAAPDAAHRAGHNLALMLLAQGRYKEGWPLYEHRFLQFGARQPKPRLSFPEWTGGPVRSLLVWGEQGFGDRIQMARFVPTLMARGIKVTFLVPPELTALFSGLGCDLITAVGEVEIPRHDAWVMSSSLPFRLGITLETLPDAPYLRAPGFRLASPRWAGKIGFIAAGDRRHHNDPQRTLDAATAARFKALSPLIESLDPADTGATDFADTAAIIERLDLVISVDTSTAHLAGAMGKPVWILLPDHETDWRWMRGRADSPWYPSARLFRQPAPGDWDSVIAAVAAELAARNV